LSKFCNVVISILLSVLDETVLFRAAQESSTSLSTWYFVDIVQAKIAA